MTEKRGTGPECFQEVEFSAVKNTFPSETRLLVTQSVDRSTTTKQRSFIHWDKLAKLLQLCALILAFGYFKHHFYRSQTSKFVDEPTTALFDKPLPQGITPPTTRYDYCTPKTIHEKEEHFELNLSSEGPKKWQLLDSTNPAAMNKLRGRRQIHVEMGIRSQPSDVWVYVHSRSSYAIDLENLVIQSSNFTLNVEYVSDNEDIDLCTEVEIFVFLRPNIGTAVDLLEIQSNILDIYLGNQLNWEINNLVTHTEYGYTEVLALRPYSFDRMIAHNMSISSFNGSIFIYGMIAPKENFNAHSEHGHILIMDLVPNFFDLDETLNLKTFSMSSNTGYLELGAPLNPEFPFWPEKDYTHQITMTTISGSIICQMPQGSLTNLSSISGDIGAYLEPYSTSDANARSEIYTTTKTGKIRFFMPKTANMKDGRYNPARNMLSEHSTELGNMTLRYGPNWWGELDVKIGRGEVVLDGDSLENVERGEGYVRVERGTRGDSRIEAQVGEGKMNVFLGDWRFD
jgi:hypothetical protein